MFYRWLNYKYYTINILQYFRNLLIELERFLGYEIETKAIFNKVEYGQVFRSYISSKLIDYLGGIRWFLINFVRFRRRESPLLEDLPRLLLKLYMIGIRDNRMQIVHRVISELIPEGEELFLDFLLSETATSFV